MCKPFSVGHTDLRQLKAWPNLYAKLEFQNPTGSAKDRAALYMIEDAEKRGLLSPGGRIIEPTSGNTGISLAAIAAQKGYEALIVMPDSMSPERQDQIRSRGGRVVLTPGDQGMAGAIAKARALAGPGDFLPDQFSNPANPRAHYETTGPELWAQTGGKLRCFVCAVGTGGTLTGTGRYLKEQDPRIRILAVEPAGSPVLSGGQPGKHGIQGIGAGFVPEILDRDLIDGVETVTEEEAFSCARLLAQKEGIFAGISSGAALAAAIRVAEKHPDWTVVTVLPDAADRYTSCGL